MNQHTAWVRKMTTDDIEWALSIAREHYSGRYSEPSVRQWLHARLSEPTMCFLRSEHVAGVAHLAKRFQNPERWQAFLTALYAVPGNHGREVLRVVEGLRDWSKGHGAGKFWMGDITGHNLGSISRILGGRLAGYTYVVDLDGDPKALG